MLNKDNHWNFSVCLSVRGIIRITRFFIGAVMIHSKFDPEEKVSFGIKISITLRGMSENAKKI